MNYKTINETALKLLARQEWTKAQELFYQNAKENPSHVTYNNLGCFLLYEGLTCKNGTVRSAKKLGKKYLERAAELGTSAINLCAIAKAYDFELDYNFSQKETILYQEMQNVLETAYRISPSNKTLYNILRIQVLSKTHSSSVLDSVRSLVEVFTCEESVRLYFTTLSLYSMYEEGVRCITKYSHYLDADDMLLFYAKFKHYTEGYNLCDTILTQFHPSKYIASAIIECCINTNHAAEAYCFANQIRNQLSGLSCRRTDRWENLVFCNFDKPVKYREVLIAEYSPIPPFLDSDYYFR